MPIIGGSVPFQWQFGSLLMGDGTSYEVIKASGFDDLPAVRVQDVARAFDHGMWAGTDFADGRTVSLDVEIVGTDDTSFRANVDALRAATVIATPGTAESTLTFMFPGGGSRQINVRPRRRLLPNDLDYKFHKAKITVEFYATDPRIYDSALQSFVLPVGVAAGGMTFNMGFNMGFGGAGTSGTAQVTNAGSFPTRPTITIAGPVDNPTIENATAGKHLTFSISLATGDSLVIDCDAHSVVLNGTASRRSTMTSDSSWWELAPGTSQINYRANTVQTGSTATVAFRSAWL